MPESVTAEALWRLLAAERQAEQLLGATEERLQRYLETVRRDVDLRRQRTVEEAKQAAAALLASAREEAEQAAARQLTEQLAQLERWREQAAARRPAAVERVVAWVIAGET